MPANLLGIYNFLCVNVSLNTYFANDNIFSEKLPMKNMNIITIENTQASHIILQIGQEYMMNLTNCSHYKLI